ncbi:hypothetical protein ABBQ32_006625 [Trebouxia sp. C0010 RCD-2024]
MLQCSSAQAPTCPLNARLTSGRRLRHSAFAGTRIPSTGAKLPQRHRQQLQTCAGKGKGKQGMRQGGGAQQMGPQMPTPPPVDPENVEFVVFVRSQKLLEWWPFTIVKGGRPANLLASSLESEWGKKLFGKALIRSIAQPIWKDKRKLEAKIRKEYPPLKSAKKIEWGFKIRDKTRPNSAFEPENLTMLPAEEDLEPTLGERVAKWLRSLRK